MLGCCRPGAASGATHTPRCHTVCPPLAPQVLQTTRSPVVADMVAHVAKACLLRDKLFGYQVGRGAVRSVGRPMGCCSTGDRSRRCARCTHYCSCCPLLSHAQSGLA